MGALWRPSIWSLYKAPLCRGIAMYVNQYDLTKTNKSRCHMIEEVPRGRKGTIFKIKQSDIILTFHPYHMGKYQIKTECRDEQLQETDNKDIVRSIMTEQAPNFYDWQRIENPTFRGPSGYFQAQVNLQTGNVTGYYYNTQSKVTFNCPWDTQTSCEEKSNQRKHTDYHNQSPTE